LLEKEVLSAIVYREGKEKFMTIKMKKMLKMDRREFLNRFSLAIGTDDIKFSYKAYYGLVRFLISEAVKEGRIDLPDLGVLRVVKYKERKAYLVGEKKVGLMPESYTIRFNPCQKLNKYLNKKLRG
jgi:nucleoid DNA-binding protein